MFLFILEGLMFSILTVHIDLKQTVAQISKNTADHVIEKSPKHNSTLLYSRRVFLAVCLAQYFIWFVRAVNWCHRAWKCWNSRVNLLTWNCCCSRYWSDVAPLFPERRDYHCLFLPVGRLPEDATPLWNRLHPARDPSAGERRVPSTSAQSLPPDHWYHTGTRGQVMV